MLLSFSLRFAHDGAVYFRVKPFVGNVTSVRGGQVIWDISSTKQLCEPYLFQQELCLNRQLTQ